MANKSAKSTLEVLPPVLKLRTAMILASALQDRDTLSMTAAADPSYTVGGHFTTIVCG